MFNPEAVKDLFAENIRSLREAEGWTQADLAARMNKSTGFVCDYEKGRTSPNLATIVAFANGFGVSPAEMLAEPALTPSE